MPNPEAVGTDSGLAGLAMVDELARLQLAARRLGCSIRLWNPPPALAELVDLAGLAEVLPCVEPSDEVGGKPEDGEEPGVEEVVDPGDPPA